MPTIGLALLKVRSAGVQEKMLEPRPSTICECMLERRDDIWQQRRNGSAHPRG
jgi:hypothetical protein